MATTFNTVWSNVDQRLEYIDWRRASGYLHLTMIISILLVIIIPWWISVPILGSLFVWLLGDMLPFIGSKIWLWKYRTERYWSEQKDRRRMATILIKRTLYDSRLSRLLRFEKKVPYLPPEIWEQILDLVLDVPFVFDAGCNVETFHRFINTHRHNPSVPFYGSARLQRKKLRLVCKSWAERMDRPYPRWIVDRVPSDYEQWINRIKRLDLGVSNRFQLNAATSHHSEGHRQRLHSILSQPTKLTSVTTVCFSLSWSDRHIDEEASLIRNLHVLPSLRSLTYIDHASRPLHQLALVKELRHSHFESLTSLYLQMWRLHDPIRLERLEVLYLDVYEYSAGQWSFPSLRHFAMKRWNVDFLRSIPSRENLLGENSSPLAGPHSHIRSLFLLEEGVNIVLDDSFWKLYSKLEDLGVSGRTATLLSKVPPDHPLYRLTITDHSRDSGRLMTLTSKIPNLRQVFSPSHDHKILESDVVSFSLFQDHRQRGIQWIDENEKLEYRRKVVLERKSSSIELSFWYLCFLYSYIDIFFYYFRERWWEPLSPYHQGHFLAIITSFGLFQAGIWVYSNYLSPQYKWVTKYSIA
jgi:hypothetical protein